MPLSPFAAVAEALWFGIRSSPTSFQPVAVWTCFAYNTADRVAEGVMIVQGGRFGGWSLYAKGGKAKFYYNVLGITALGDQLMTARMWNTMLSRSALAALTAISVIVCGACGSREPTTDAERLARGRELVQQMSARLAAATAVSATTTEVRDIVHVSGSKESVSQTGVYTVRRPDRFYAKMTGGRGLETWYNGKTLTIAAHPDKVFAQAPMPETIDRTLDAIAERYDMALPMGDLFYSSAAKALLSDTATGGYVGKENVGNTQAVHLAFKDVGVDWDVWLPVQGDPLPLRLKVLQKSRKGQPVVDVTFTSWDFAPKITDATFVPKVPAEYEGIALAQRAAAVKGTAATPPAAAAQPKK